MMKSRAIEQLISMTRNVRPYMPMREADCSMKGLLARLKPMGLKVNPVRKKSRLHSKRVQRDATKRAPENCDSTFVVAAQVTRPNCNPINNESPIQTA